MKSELKLNNTYTVMYSASIPITLEITGSLKHSYLKEICTRFYVLKRWSWLCCFMVTLSGCCSSFHSSSKNDRFCKVSQGFVMFPVLTEGYSTTVQNCEKKNLKHETNVRFDVYPNHDENWYLSSEHPPWTLKPMKGKFLNISKFCGSPSKRQQHFTQVRCAVRRFRAHWWLLDHLFRVHWEEQKTHKAWKRSRQL